MDSQTLKTLMSSGTDEWGTADNAYEPLNNAYNFTLDPCATGPEGIWVEEKKDKDLIKVLYHTPSKCAKFFTIEDDGLSQSWEGETIFMNPPYSKCKQWMQKLYEETRKPNTRGIALVPARTETKWFQIAWEHASNIFFYHGRYGFLKNGLNPSSATFPSVAIEFDWRVNRDKYGNIHWRNFDDFARVHNRYIGLVDRNFQRMSE